MAGSRRRHGGRSSEQGAGSSSPEDADSSSPEDAAPSTREVTIVEKPSKGTCHTSSSTSSGPCVCADLPDSLLHQIIVFISSFQDFLAFIGTCQHWRAVVSSLPSVFAFSFPPLHLKPDAYVCPHSRGIKPLRLSNCKWKLSDITKNNLSFRCSAPKNIPNEMHYLGCSHGYLIFTYEEHCLLIDAYTGVKVKAPELPCNNLCDPSGIGILTARFSSPNSRLLLFSRASMFEWQVGTNSWSEHPLHPYHECINQVVSFKGNILVIDALMRLHTIQLTPQFSMKEVAVTWPSLQSVMAGEASPGPASPGSPGLFPFPLAITQSRPLTRWLVVCGDMLLMVDLANDEHNGTISFFEVFRLDFSVKPANWVQMERLENHALFLSLNRRNPTFSCMNPERWGGKSNCVYIASARLFDDSYPEEKWTELEVGQSVSHSRIADIMEKKYGHGREPDYSQIADYSQIGGLWLFPSLVYCSSQ